MKNKILNLINHCSSIKEISEKSGIPYSTVRYHLDDANKQTIENNRKAFLNDNINNILRSNACKHKNEEVKLLKDNGISRRQIANYFNINMSTVNLHLNRERRKKINKKSHLRQHLREKEIRKVNKLEAIRLKGGKCLRCEYNKCHKALEFHHVDPNIKENIINSFKGKKTDWPKIKKELEKCILLCSICHVELHEDLWNLKDFNLNM